MVNKTANKEINDKIKIANEEEYKLKKINDILNKTLDKTTEINNKITTIIGSYNNLKSNEKKIVNSNICKLGNTYISDIKEIAKSYGGDIKFEGKNTLLNTLNVTGLVSICATAEKINNMKINSISTS